MKTKTLVLLSTSLVLSAALYNIGQSFPVSSRTPASIILEEVPRADNIKQRVDIITSAATAQAAGIGIVGTTTQQSLNAQKIENTLKQTLISVMNANGIVIPQTSKKQNEKENDSTSIFSVYDYIHKLYENISKHPIIEQVKTKLSAPHAAVIVSRINETIEALPTNPENKEKFEKLTKLKNDLIQHTKDNVSPEIIVKDDTTPTTTLTPCESGNCAIPDPLKSLQEKLEKDNQANLALIKEMIAEHEKKNSKKDDKDTNKKKDRKDKKEEKDTLTLEDRLDIMERIAELQMKIGQQNLGYGYYGMGIPPMANNVFGTNPYANTNSLFLPTTQVQYSLVPQINFQNPITLPSYLNYYMPREQNNYFDNQIYSPNNTSNSLFRSPGSSNNGLFEFTEIPTRINTL